MEYSLNSTQMNTSVGRLENVEYTFSSKENFSKDIRKTFNTTLASSGSSNLTFDLKGDNLICPQHHQNKNIFLFNDYTDVNLNFTKFSRICINCESDIKEVKGGIDSKLYDIIIRQNKSKIKEIREQKTSLGADTPLCFQTTEKWLENTLYNFGDDFFE